MSGVGEGLVLGVDYYLWSWVGEGGEGLLTSTSGVGVSLVSRL